MIYDAVMEIIVYTVIYNSVVFLFHFLQGVLTCM